MTLGCQDRCIFKPITPPNANIQQITVGELMTVEGTWDWNMIHNIFWEVDSEEVKRLPIDMTVGGDKLIWNYSKNGEYTVKTEYHLAHANVETTSHGDLCGFSNSLRHMWKLKIPSKIKIHIWRSIFNALPVRHNLMIRGISGDISCPFCSLCPEDIMHVFWFSSRARKVWKTTGLWSIISSFKGGSFADLFCWMEDHGRTDEF